MNRISEAPENENSSIQSSFLRETAHIPQSVEQTQPGSVPDPDAPGDFIPQGWTAQLVADQFSGMFALLETAAPFFRPGPSDHWKLSPEKALELGNAMLPVFERHVPFGAGAPAWLTDAMMYLGAAGAFGRIILPAVKAEIQIFRAAANQKKGKPSTAVSSAASTQTETSEVSSSSQGKEEAESPSSSSVNLDAASLAY